MSCASLLLQHTCLSLYLSLANLNNLITESGGNLLKSLVSRFSVDRINTCFALVSFSN